MKDVIVNFINTATGMLWGPFMLILLLGGGIFLSFRLRFLQVTHFSYIWSQTLGSLFKKKEISDIEKRCRR